METITLPSRLLDQAKAATGTRSARAAVIRALEKIIAQEAPYQPGPELTKKILAQRGKPAREFSSVKEMNAAMDRGEI